MGAPPPPQHHAPPRDPVAAFLGRPVPKREHTEYSVPATKEGVRTLASSGAWYAAASLSERLISHNHPIDELLHLRWYRIVALLKLREFSSAEREMASLGDLRSQSWHYDRYPQKYPGRSGTMVPFQLQVLSALLPAYSGNHDHALARLYTLLDGETKCAAAASSSSAGGGGVARLGERAQVLLAIVNVLCAVHDHANAIAHLEQLVELMQQQPSGGGGAREGGGGADKGAETGDRGAEVPPPSMSSLLSLLGRIHLQAGNTTAAEDAFLKLECLLPSADEDLAVRLNRGLLAMSLSQYAPALVEFEAALAIEPSSVVAANNTALCQLYTCRLADAIKTLEGHLRARPRENCDATLVANLAALYYLNAPVGQDTNKATLERLVMAVKADDFDMSALEPPQ